MKWDILFVEDQPKCLTGLTRKLDKSGYIFKLVPNRKLAEDILQSDQIRLLFLDVRLESDKELDPHTSGLQVLSKLRKKVLGTINTDIPVIVFTGYPELEIEDEIKERGQSRMLAKPCSIDILFELVTETLKNNNQEKDKHV